MAHLPRGIKHVDRDSLYTDLAARVSYLKSFIEFGPGKTPVLLIHVLRPTPTTYTLPDDLAALEQGQDLVRMVIPDIVNSVYKKLLQYDITARVFSTRDSRDDEDPPVWPQDGSPAIQNRKIFLRWYLTRLNQDPSKMEFWEYLDKVGEMHVGSGRRNPLHVDYLFLGICMGYIQDAFTEAILTNNTIELRLRISIVRALGKLIWIQNDLLARWHINENNLGANPLANSQTQTSTRPRPATASASPVPPKAQNHPYPPPTTSFLLPDTETLSTQFRSRKKSDAGSHASSGKTSLGRRKESMDGFSYSSGESGGCPFSGSAMDYQRAGQGWPLSNDSTRNSAERPATRQRGWI
jgi:hypothetical protein